MTNTEPTPVAADVEALTRPIIGIEYRSPDEVFAIMRDRIKHALSSLPSMAWQPIETAPKDGTLVLGWFLHRNESRFQIGIIMYHAQPGGGWWSSSGLPVVPTLWRPLPLPPAIERGEHLTTPQEEG